MHHWRRIDIAFVEIYTTADFQLGIILFYSFFKLGQTFRVLFFREIRFVHEKFVNGPTSWHGSNLILPTLLQKQDIFLLEHDVLLKFSLIFKQRQI